MFRTLAALTTFFREYSIDALESLRRTSEAQSGFNDGLQSVAGATEGKDSGSDSQQPVNRQQAKEECI